MRLKIPKISHDEAISAFIKGLCFHEGLWSKLLHKRPSTVAELLATAKNYANADDAEKLIREDVRGTQQNEQPPRLDDTQDNRGRFDNCSLRCTTVTTEKGGTGTATIVMISGVNDLVTTTTKSTKSSGLLVDAIMWRTTIKL